MQYHTVYPAVSKDAVDQKMYVQKRHPLVGLAKKALFVVAENYNDVTAYKWCPVTRGVVVLE